MSSHDRALQGMSSFSVYFVYFPWLIWWNTLHSERIFGAICESEVDAILQEEVFGSENWRSTGTSEYYRNFGSFNSARSLGSQEEGISLLRLTGDVRYLDIEAEDRRARRLFWSQLWSPSAAIFCYKYLWYTSEKYTFLEWNCYELCVITTEGSIRKYFKIIVKLYKTFGSDGNRSLYWMSNIHYDQYFN